MHKPADSSADSGGFSFWHAQLAGKLSPPDLRQAGFTLLELMIVITILGLLAFVAAPPFLRYLDSAKHNTAKIEIQALGGALDLYAFENGRYPSSEEGLRALLEKPATAPLWHGPYLKRAEMINDPWGRPFYYRAPGRHGSYDLYSAGSNANDPADDAAVDLRSW
jgi:general secretion pathway protein G